MCRSLLTFNCRLNVEGPNFHLVGFCRVIADCQILLGRLIAVCLGTPGRFPQDSRFQRDCRESDVISDCRQAREKSNGFLTSLVLVVSDRTGMPPCRRPSPLHPGDALRQRWARLGKAGMAKIYGKTNFFAAVGSHLSPWMVAGCVAIP